jgi:dolichyl-phosphate-mannose-protein mannosyltransferase
VIRRRAGEVLAVAALLAALALQLTTAIAADGLTNDEVLYIAAGYRHLTAGDYRLNPTTPPLAKLVAATGLLGLRLPLPEWREGQDPLDWSYRFVNVENDPSRLVRRARVPDVVLTLLLAALVWWWARLRGGVSAGLLALALFAFHPSLLAHGHLATTDLPAAAFALVASFALWKWTSGRQPAWLIAAAVGVGAAAATRLTGWLLLPALAMVAGVEWRRSGVRRLRELMLAAVSMVLVPLVVVWASYRFQRAPWPGASVYESVSPRLGVAGRMVEAAQEARLLPEAYLEGARYQVEHGRFGHPAYLLGERSRTGWWSYFAVAFAVKNTPGFLLVLLVALFLAWKAPPEAAAVHWLVPAALIFVAASAGSLQLGERYILPVYAYLILWTSTVWTRRLRGRPLGVLLGLALLLHVVPALRVAPRGYLTYFNALAGGPAGGHRVLLDSNLDWGQDLPRLAAWMRAHGVGRVQLGYHGSDDPDRYGIVHEDLPGVRLYAEQPAARPFTGTVAVSPNLLFGLFPRLDSAYAPLRARPPDDRAGIFFIYRMGEAPAAQARSSSSRWMSPVTSARPSPTYMSISLRTPNSGR